VTQLMIRLIVTILYKLVMFIETFYQITSKKLLS